MAGSGFAGTTPESLRGPVARRMALPWIMAGLVLLVLVTGVVSLSLGASGLAPWAPLTRDLSPAESAILWAIRLPRLFLAALVGAGLAVSGALMQGLFRNPLADPGLMGVSAGAGLGAVVAIVLGGALPAGLLALTGVYLVPVMAFAGGWTVTLILYRIASQRGQTSISTMLLAGIVIGALAGAAMGMLIYRADDSQLRDLTFWSLGSLAGANWVKLLAVAPAMVIGFAVLPSLAAGLNAMALGEAVARHMGVPVERVKRHAILSVALMTGASVAVSGGIGFVGIVVPHILRMAIGPDHRGLLPASALLGAALMMAADCVARVVVAPAELPISILTALFGAPVFLWILLSRRGGMEG